MHASYGNCIEFFYLKSIPERENFDFTNYRAETKDKAKVCCTKMEETQKNTKFNKQKKSTGAPIEVKHHNSSKVFIKRMSVLVNRKTDFFLSGTLSSIMFLRLEKTMLDDFVLAVLSAFVQQGL